MSVTKNVTGPCQHCGGLIQFSPEAVGNLATCPSCGKETELTLSVPKMESGLPVKTIVFSVVAVVILVGGLIAAQMALNRAKRMTGDNNQPAANAPDAAGSFARQGFEVSEVTLEESRDSSLVHAVGSVRDISGKRRFGVRIELDVLDAAGQKIGSARDYTATLEGGAEWRFKAMVITSKAASGRVAAIVEDQ